ncbi:replication initiator protein A [Staphylococcus equorum]|uniref:replication initiator protein A n=1 Tax=Staphylococcus equorum TaxID=246432 RepID=UPI0024087039|nr:replication initiator protein A [Staphylococcus equorum]MDG0826350.1 replication initiator protein A [Staphylococcus equorum]
MENINKYNLTNHESIRLPKILFDSPIYKELSVNAKVLYGILYTELIELAIEKGISDITDENGDFYLTYPHNNLAKYMNVSRNTITRVKQELEYIGLLEIVKQKNKLDIFYLTLLEEF